MAEILVFTLIRIALQMILLKLSYAFEFDMLLVNITFLLQLWCASFVFFSVRFS